MAPNAVRLELVLIAQDLMCWAQSLLLEGDLARAEPKRLRYRLLHLAGRITRSGRAAVPSPSRPLALGGRGSSAGLLAERRRARFCPL